MQILYHAHCLHFRKLKHAFLEGTDQPAEPPQRKQPIQLPKESPPTPTRRVVPTSPPATVPSPPSSKREEEFEETEELYDDANIMQKAATSPGPKMPNLLAQGMPQRPPDSDEEEEDQNWDG